MSIMLEAGGSLSDRNFRSIADLIESEVGIRLPEGKRVMLEGRLRKRMRVLNQTDLNEYAELLFEHDHLHNELVHLIDCVTTNKTDFFREPSHFAFMRDVAVPEILQRRGAGHVVKIWSSACSTGMEAYTAAIVLNEMHHSGTRFQYRLLGTDISTGVLNLARAGIYTREMIAPVPDDMVKRYFLSSKEKARGEVRVIPELRRTVHFMRMNLMDTTYPVDSDVDFIFCRNVLIYFDKPTQRKVVARLCSHLRPGGYLVVGHSESMVHDGTTGMVQVQPTIFKMSNRS